MKYWYLGAAALVLTIAAGVFLCRKKTSPGPEIDGGVRRSIDENAPKVIKSTQITSFYCKFSTTDRLRGDSPIAGHLITLQAEEGAGSFALRGYTETSGSFIPDAAFFRQLQKTVAQYDFAQYNGQHYTVSGLPPDYGMTLEIRYASGETIRSSDNQSCFLPLEAMEALVALFEHYK